MQIIKSLCKLLFFISPAAVMAQSANLTQGDKIFHFVDRFEIKYRDNTGINYSTIKPYNRKYVVQEAELFDSIAQANPAALKLTSIDKFNMRRLLMNNTEWVSGSKEDFTSTKPILKYFYTTKPNLLEVNAKDFFLAVNPVLNLQLGSQSGNDDRMFINTRGVTLRGLIARKIGFAATMTDNQERGPSYFLERVNSFRAVPGVGFYKGFKTRAFDYFDARGYISFNAAKYIDIQFGYDKNFIGNGYRSLFLSDWGNSYLFLKLNTKIWKFNYQNIFAELMPQFVKQGDSLLDRKYTAMHHLSINVTKWLNIGLFESVMFGRKNHFDFQYLNPIIFYRHIEGTVGSPDNALAGIDFKANVAHSLQVYGQLLLDEFKLSQIRANTGWWANKWGLQLGAKYIDAFGVPNLDIQVESNRIRPFTYSHNNIISNATHYNQPLAHPLGANLQEFIGIIKYQPAPRWYVHARMIYYYQGLDSLNGRNYGSNPFRIASDQRVEDYGYKIGSGRKATCLNALLVLTYEPWENINFELSMQQRNYSIANEAASKNNSTLISAGVRMNIFRREYDF
jgi:hypothetical protein